MQASVRVSALALLVAFAVLPAILAHGSFDTEGGKRVVILMIGDGMGPAVLEATSLYVAGAPEASSSSKWLLLPGE